MATIYGKTAFQALKAFRSTKWFTKDFITFASEVSSKYADRSEVLFGGILTAGTCSGTAIPVSLQAGEVKLAGKHHPFAAISARDLHASTLLIYKDGSAAHGDTLTGATGNYVSVIACNSDAAGDVIDEGTAPLIVGIINGTDPTTAAASTAPLSSRAIQDALEASSSVHDAVTGWVHIAYIHDDIVNDSETVVSNINNHLGL